MRTNRKSGDQLLGWKRRGLDSRREVEVPEEGDRRRRRGSPGDRPNRCCSPVQERRVFDELEERGLEKILLPFAMMSKRLDVVGLGG